MKKFFFILAACTMGFTANSYAMTNESEVPAEVTVSSNDIDEDFMLEIFALINEYVDSISHLRGNDLDDSIDELQDILYEMDETEEYEAALTYLFIAIEEEIPGRGFTMERFEAFYPQITKWKTRLENLTPVNDATLDKWLNDFMAYCDTLSYDEQRYALFLMERYVEDLINE